ncbi:MAG: aminopeptidase N [Pseudomonadota bacterium]
MRTATGQAIRLEDYLPPQYHVENVDLEVMLDPKATRIVSRLTIVRAEGTAADAPLVLDGDELTLKGLSVDGAALGENAYTLSEDELAISSLPSTDQFEVEIETEVAPETNTKLMGLYRSSGVYCTQCEAEGFRRITFFPDRPDVLATYTTKIIGNKSDSPILLGNGNLVETGDLDDGLHYATWHDPHPKPSYLFALVGGDLGVLSDDFTTMSGRDVELNIYVEKGKEKDAHWAMDSLRRSMKWDEERFGCEYDLDIFNIVAVSDFNMGAMENKGLNIFNDKYVLANPDTATDTDYANVEAIIAHEYFHNWTGNRITCRDWFQLCLKEGLTVFRDQEFSSDERSRAVKRIADVVRLRMSQFPEDGGPLAHPVRPETYKEINNFYTPTVYEKGAELVRMIATLLGEEGFRAGMDHYLSSQDGNAATVEDFLASFETATGYDLGQFKLWYQQSGTPRLLVSTHYDAAKKTFSIDLEQSLPATPGQSNKKPMVIPIRFGLLDDEGRDMKVSTVMSDEVKGDLIILTKRQTRIVFDGIGERPVASLLRGFSAPVVLEYEQSRDEMAFLAAKDNDLFNRWQALNSFGLTLMTEAVRDGASDWIDERYLSTLENLAIDTDLEPAFRAFALTPPGESDVARAIGKDIDPDRIHAVRTALDAAIAKRIAPLGEELQAELAPETQYSPGATSAGKRALRLALDSFAIRSGAIDDLEEKYASCANLTERLAIVGAVLKTHGHGSASQAVLDRFFADCDDDPLVIDKWFSIQSMQGGADTLDRVQSLLKHPAYDARNPNRIRSLVGMFGLSNPTGFNRADGAGYNFLADQVLEIDKFNPQVASRLLTAFRSWRMMESGRRTKAEAALGRILSSEGLSRDVSEIAERMLA